MTFPTAQSRADKLTRPPRRAFTLIELILVMALLAIAAAVSAPRMSSFFRGRTLDQEARRLLALTHYAQSRAVANGVPVLLWVNASNSTYGMMLQSGYATSEDDRATTYQVDSTLSIEAKKQEPVPESETGEELYGLPEETPVIRFNPDGFIDPVSLSRIIIRQGDEGALEITQTTNGLAYEIRPYDLHANR